LILWIDDPVQAVGDGGDKQREVAPACLGALAHYRGKGARRTGRIGDDQDFVIGAWAAHRVSYESMSGLTLKRRAQRLSYPWPAGVAVGKRRSFSRSM
jgi:hypothetical protein